MVCIGTNRNSHSSDRATNDRAQICGIADEEPEFRKGDLFLSLSAGSGTNIRPDLVMDTFVKDRGLLPDPYRFMINRDEVYADLGGERPGSDRFVPLIGLGTTME